MRTRVADRRVLGRGGDRGGRGGGRGAPRGGRGGGAKGGAKTIVVCIFTKLIWTSFNMIRNPIAMQVSLLPVEKKTCW